MQGNGITSYDVLFPHSITTVAIIESALGLYSLHVLL